MSFTALTSKYVGKTVFGYTLGSYFKYIKWILILSILSFVLYKGYDIYDSFKQMEKTIADQSNVIEDLNNKVSGLEQANKDLKKAEEQQEKSGEVSSNSVGELAKNNEKTNNTFNEIKEQVKSDAAAVKAKPVKRVINKETKVVTEVQMTEGEITESVSRVRITAIWRSYCSSNKPDETSAQSCKDVVI